MDAISGFSVCFSLELPWATLDVFSSSLLGIFVHCKYCYVILIFERQRFASGMQQFYDGEEG